MRVKAKRKIIKFGICPVCRGFKKLTRHHDPIMKKDGGKQIVLICRHCHQSLNKGIIINP